MKSLTNNLHYGRSNRRRHRTVKTFAGHHGPVDGCRNTNRQFRWNTVTNYFIREQPAEEVTTLLCIIHNAVQKCAIRSNSIYGPACGCPICYIASGSGCLSITHRGRGNDGGNGRTWREPARKREEGGREGGMEGGRR